MESHLTVTQHLRYTLATRPGDDPDLVVARLWAAGALGVWQLPDALVSWFAERTDAVPPGGTWEHEPERDWQAEWKATIAPVHAGRIAIVPTWLADTHVPEADELTIVLDPGQAFGSGHHATTTLCLELLQELEVAGRTVLDVGCGTGVLAIAAARLGAARVHAVDVDPDAVEVTRQNADQCGVEVTTAVGSVDGTTTHDLVLANLVTDTIVALAAELAAATGGTLVASGIAVEREDRAFDALRGAGLDVTDTRRRDGWAACTARHPGADR